MPLSNETFNPYMDDSSNTAVPAKTKTDEETRLRNGIEDIINDINAGKVRHLEPVIFRLKSLIVK